MPFTNPPLIHTRYMATTPHYQTSGHQTAAVHTLVATSADTWLTITGQPGTATGSATEVWYTLSVWLGAGSRATTITFTDATDGTLTSVTSITQQGCIDYTPNSASSSITIPYSGDVNDRCTVKATLPYSRTDTTQDALITYTVTCPASWVHFHAGQNLTFTSSDPRYYLFTINSHTLPYTFDVDANPTGVTRSTTITLTSLGYPCATPPAFTINQAANPSPPPVITGPPGIGNPSPGSGMSADAHNGVLSVLWGGASTVNFARHLSPSSSIGSGTAGWESTQVIDTVAAATGGLLYLADDSLLLVYNNVCKNNTSFGAAGAWLPSTSDFRVSGGNAGRAQRTSFIFGLHGTYDGAYDGSGMIYFTRDMSANGGQGLGATLDSGCPGQRVGGVYLEDRWGCLYTLVVVTGGATSEVNYWRTDTTGSTGTTWGASYDKTVVSTVTDRIASLTKTLGTKVLVGLTWNVTTRLCKGIHSYDRGVTWVQDSSAISIIPAMDVPPVVVAMQDGVYAVWVVLGTGGAADVPTFAYSGDAGLTWV